LERRLLRKEETHGRESDQRLWSPS